MKIRCRRSRREIIAVSVVYGVIWYLLRSAPSQIWPDIDSDLLMALYVSALPVGILLFAATDDGDSRTG